MLSYRPFVEGIITVETKERAAYAEISIMFNSKILTSEGVEYLRNYFIIPEGVTTIARGAFENCSGLETVVIPASVTHIDTSAFFAASSIKNILFAENSQLSTLGDYVFDLCHSLASINLPEGLTAIGEEAFAGCKSLESIIIPASVESIGRFAFWGCDNLKSITFAEGSKLHSIDYCAFLGCEMLTAIDLPSSISYINKDAFPEPEVSINIAQGKKSSLIDKISNAEVRRDEQNCDGHSDVSRDDNGRF